MCFSRDHYGRLPFEFGSPNSYIESFKAFPSITAVAQALSARAHASLASGNSASAARDLCDVIKLEESLSPYPVLFCQMMRAGAVACALPVIELVLPPTHGPTPS